METIQIVGDILLVVLAASLVFGQYRLGKRIEQLDIEDDFNKGWIEQLQFRIVQNEIKKPAVRKPAVKKEAK